MHPCSVNSPSLRIIRQIKKHKNSGLTIARGGFLFQASFVYSYGMTGYGMRNMGTVLLSCWLVFPFS